MFSVVVLAAGGSRRMGFHKLLKHLWGRPLISWSVESAVASGCDEVVVVVGNEAERVVETLPEGVKYVVNEDWAEGVASSIRRGVESLSPCSEAVVVMVADQPLTAPVIPSLLARLVLQGKYLLAFASVEGDPRSPGAFHRSLFQELLKLEGDKGAKSLYAPYRDRAALLEVPEEMLVDVDTPEELENLSRRGPPNWMKGIA
ncbi:MAG: nucleotidyltransferase family protein [Nitrososphaerota archaeon]